MQQGVIHPSSSYRPCFPTLDHQTDPSHGNKFRKQITKAWLGQLVSFHRKQELVSVAAVPITKAEETFYLQVIAADKS